MTIYKGVHGTCVGAATSILQQGPKLTKEGRAGSGFYLWAYDSDADFALHLARGWHKDRDEDDAYNDYRHIHKGTEFAAIFFEIDVDPNSVCNMNVLWRHEKLRSVGSRMPRGTDIGKIYDDHLRNASLGRQKAGFGTINLVEAMVSYPNATKSTFSGPPLTPGGDAYIVLNDGLRFLKPIDLVGVPAKGGWYAAHS